LWFYFTMKSANTYTHQILRTHRAGENPVAENDYAEFSLDFILGHDATTALLVDDFYRFGGKIWDKGKALFTADHFAPPASEERANILKKFLDFCREQKVENLALFSGICHQLLVEHPAIVPGKLVIGADSHTVMAGALGCLAAGMGSTDVLYGLITGRIRLKVPECFKITFTGTQAPFILGKDIILKVLADLEEDGALYRSLEFVDSTDNGISMDSRFSISNMVVEGGAKAGIFIPDAITQAYLQEKGADNYAAVTVPEQPVYEREIPLDVSSLAPQVAIPPHPSHAVPVGDVAGEHVDQVYIGSCTGGRVEDLRIAAEILKGKKAAPYCRLVVIPSSNRIYLQAMEKGYIQTLIEAGAAICNPSCGPCGKIDKGIIAEGETCLATSNRNFDGRMGGKGSRVFLCSTATAAASAIEGKITDPRKHF
jgi:3-isopropylmalate/(R)-2-methylmalate dehydratase large subunit